MHGSGGWSRLDSSLRALWWLRRSPTAAAVEFCLGGLCATAGSLQCAGGRLPPVRGRETNDSTPPPLRLPGQVSEVRARERKLMFWNAVVKTINVTMVFGVPPCVLFAVLIPYELTHYEGQNTVYVKPQVSRGHEGGAGPRAWKGVSGRVLWFGRAGSGYLLGCQHQHTLPSRALFVGAPPLDHPFTPHFPLPRRLQTAFTMLSLFNVLRFPLVVLPKALRCVSEALNASRNLEKFLAEPAAPKQDTEGAPGGELLNVSGLGAGAWDRLGWLAGCWLGWELGWQGVLQGCRAQGIARRAGHARLAPSPPPSASPHRRC